MNLKRAQKIAKSVGARIIERGPNDIEIVIGVPVFNSDGTAFRQSVYAMTPEEAARTAVLVTAQASKNLLDLAKRVYVDEDLLL